MNLRKNMCLKFLSMACVYFVTAMTLFAAAETAKVQKLKVKGVVVAHEGDVVKIQDKKDNSVHAFTVTDRTKIERDKGLFSRTTMDAVALVPGLTIEVEGVQGPEGTPVAKTIKFKPDAFAITVAQQKQIQDNQAVASHAQSTADGAVASASNAQSSADHAQSTANQGVSTAQAAGMLAAADTVGVQMLNQRVSELGEYTPVAELGIYFPENSHRLSTPAKKALDQLIAANANVNGYIVQIAGYASSTGSAQYNLRLSQERAAAVAQYLRENNDVPIVRIAMPAGYGETHPAASNAEAKGRALNRRVEVTILASKALQGGFITQSATAGKNLAVQ